MKSIRVLCIRFSLVLRRGWFRLAVWGGFFWDVFFFNFYRKRGCFRRYRLVGVDMGLDDVCVCVYVYGRYARCECTCIYVGLLCACVGVFVGYVWV